MSRMIKLGVSIKVLLLSALCIALLLPVFVATTQSKITTTSNEPKTKSTRLNSVDEARERKIRDVGTTTFENWSVTCNVRTEVVDTGNGCVALMNVIISADDPRSLLILIILKDENGERMLLKTPSSVNLAPGTQITFGDNQVRHLAFTSCEPAMCSAEVLFDPELANEMSTSSKANVAWTSLTMGEVEVEFALGGAKDSVDFLAKKQAR